MDSRKATLKLTDMVDDINLAAKNLPKGVEYSEKSILHVLVRTDADKQTVKSAFKTMSELDVGKYGNIELVVDTVPGSLLR